jgi:hypothetical protein
MIRFATLHHPDVSTLLLRCQPDPDRIHCKLLLHRYDTTADCVTDPDFASHATIIQPNLEAHHADLNSLFFPIASHFQRS